MIAGGAGIALVRVFKFYFLSPTYCAYLILNDNTHSMICVTIDIPVLGLFIIILDRASYYLTKYHAMATQFKRKLFILHNRAPVLIILERGSYFLEKYHAMAITWFILKILILHIKKIVSPKSVENSMVTGWLQTCAACHSRPFW